MNNTVLAEEQISSIKEAFSLFDKDGDGIIDINFLGLLVRSLNQYPTELEVEEMKKEVDPESTSKIDFPEFLSLMARRMKDTDPEEELLEAFRVIDKSNSRFINTEELRHNLTSNGEKFSTDEAQEMIEEAMKISGGEEIDYEEFTKVITSKHLNI